MVKAELIGIGSRLNPFAKVVDMTFKFERSIVWIPVDYRQVRFILKEHPVGSQVDLAYDGRWSIMSHHLAPEHDIDQWLYGIY